MTKNIFNNKNVFFNDKTLSFYDKNSPFVYKKKLTKAILWNKRCDISRFAVCVVWKFSQLSDTKNLKPFFLFLFQFKQQMPHIYWLHFSVSVQSWTWTDWTATPSARRWEPDKTTFQVNSRWGGPSPWQQRGRGREGSWGCGGVEPSEKFHSTFLRFYFTNDSAHFTSSVASC